LLFFFQNQGDDILKTRTGPGDNHWGFKGKGDEDFRKEAEVPEKIDKPAAAESLYRPRVGVSPFNEIGGLGKQPDIGFAKNIHGRPPFYNTDVSGFGIGNFRVKKVLKGNSQSGRPKRVGPVFFGAEFRHVFRMKGDYAGSGIPFSQGGNKITEPRFDEDEKTYILRQP
jgi:hypothetical protein